MKDLTVNLATLLLKLTVILSVLVSSPETASTRYHKPVTHTGVLVSPVKNSGSALNYQGLSSLKYDHPVIKPYFRAFHFYYNSAVKRLLAFNLKQVRTFQDPTRVLIFVPHLDDEHLSLHAIG